MTAEQRLVQLTETECAIIAGLLRLEKLRIERELQHKLGCGRVQPLALQDSVMSALEKVTDAWRLLEGDTD